MNKNVIHPYFWQWLLWIVIGSVLWTMLPGHVRVPALLLVLLGGALAVEQKTPGGIAGLFNQSIPGLETKSI